MSKRSPSKGILRMRLGRVIAALLAVVLVLALSMSILWLPDPRRGSGRLRSKVRNLNAYLEQGEVLEFNHSSFPALRKLFETFEGSTRLHVAPNARMGDYDRSCEAYYKESLFPGGNLNRSAYSQLEYLHRVHHLNRTGKMEVKACDTKSPRGCCLACNVPSCCLCAYDGEADLERDLETVPAMKNLRVDSMTGRKFNLKSKDEARLLATLYGKAMVRLGFKGDEKSFQRLTTIKNYSYMPPGGFLAWHTNRFDNNRVPYRIYFISVDRGFDSTEFYQDFSSSFKYLLPWSELVDVKDFNGAVRFFKNTRTNVDAEEAFLWHTAVSESAHRFSLGFEIYADLIVGLLDSCGAACWEKLGVTS